MREPSFKFALEQQVVIASSDATGVVIARAEYTYAEQLYLLRFADKQGLAREEWWTESALEAA